MNSQPFIQQKQKKRVLSLLATLSIGLIIWAGLWTAVRSVRADAAISVEINTAYNLVVDSNVSSPSTYAPRAATVYGTFCNDGDTDLTDVYGYIGDNKGGVGSTPGLYPSRDSAIGAFQTEHPWAANTGSYAFTHIGGTADASRYIGDLGPGQCKVQYWHFTYPACANTGAGAAVEPPCTTTPTWGTSVKAHDDLWLEFDIWATGQDGITLLTDNARHKMTMRNEISAMANKIKPNPDGYWFNTDTSVIVPGQVITTNGVLYTLGNIRQGFDNDGNFTPDYNAWLQPFGDPSYDPSCFRLIRTTTVLTVSRSAGQPNLILNVDDLNPHPVYGGPLYFTNLPADNNGVDGEVRYTFLALNGPCSVPISPYQEVASGSDNEKFNGDYGTGIPPIMSRETNMSLDKTGQTSIGPGGTINYEITFTLPDYDDTPGNDLTLSVGDPSVGMPLVFQETIPDGLEYVGGTASASVTMENYTSASVPATLRYSLDSGATWTTGDPGNATSTAPNGLVILQWWLGEAITSPASGPDVRGTVSFNAVVPGGYAEPFVDNTACLQFGEANCFIEDTHRTLVTGPYELSGNVFRDDGGTTGTSGDGIKNGDETNIGNVTVYLYINGILIAETETDIAGNYSFTQLPAGTYEVRVDKSDPDIDEGYGLTTAEIRSATLSAGNPSQSGLNFGFAPALDVRKTLLSSNPALVGETVSYQIEVMNTLPGNGEATEFCTYNVWTTIYHPTTGQTPPGGGPTNAQWQNPHLITGTPDQRYAYSIMANNPDTIGLSGLNIGDLGGNITQVEYVVHIRERSNLAAADRFFVRVWQGDVERTETTYFGDDATYFGTGGTGTEYVIRQVLAPAAIVARPNWLWSDFTANNMELQLEARGSGGSTGDVEVDAVGFVITTDNPCGGADSVLNPVPLTDTFDANYFTFVAADPPVSSSAPGLLTWDNVGPLYPGQTRLINVYLTATQVGTAPDTTNTATSSGAKFANGLPANSPVTSQATLTVNPNPNTRSFSGTIFDDNSNPLNGWSGAAWTRAGAETGMDAGDTGLAGVRVDLYACYTISTNVLFTGSTNQPCTAAQDREWRLVRSGFTNNDGNYAFNDLAQGFYYAQVDTNTVVGGQVADVNESGLCVVCDSRSNNPLTTNLNATFVGNLSANTSVTRVNFGYNYPTGSYNIGDFLFFDWNGDGIQDAEDEPMNGVTVRLLNPAGTVIATQVTGEGGNADGEYLFTNIPNGVYTVQVDTSTLPPSLMQSYDPDGALDNRSTFALDGATDLTRDFGYQPVGAGSIGDTVWRDLNGDGVKNGVLETGIEGVEVQLQVDLNGDGIYVTIATQTTDQDGKYLFENLPLGVDYNYRVVLELTPANLDLIPEDTFGNKYANTTGTLEPTFIYHDVVLTTVNPEYRDADFGFAPASYIGDFIWQDNNGDGLWQSNEPGINNVVVELYCDPDNTGDVNGANVTLCGTDTTVTVNGKAGHYLFSNLPAGNYIVKVADSNFDPGGALEDFTLTGDPNSYNTVDPTNLSCEAIGAQACDGINPISGFTAPDGTTFLGLPVGQTDLTSDFGYRPLGVIGDTVWIDGNNNGVRDPGEAGIPFVDVQLCADATCTAVLQTVPTDENGNYTFAGLTDGTEYWVRVVTTDPDFPTGGLTPSYDYDGTADSIINKIVLTDGKVSSVNDVLVTCPVDQNCNLDMDFGYRYEGIYSLSGNVFYDLNQNGGNREVGEPGYVGQPMYLWREVGLNSYVLAGTTTTDANGEYSFADLPNGTYVVSTEATSPNLNNAAHTTNINQNDATAWEEVVISDPVGGVVEDVDFGFFIPTDFDDLPDSYNTTLSGGAYHINSGEAGTLRLGAGIDLEPNGLPNVDASNDDFDDGVTRDMSSRWLPGEQVTLVITVTNGSGVVGGWFDWNNDGDFTDAGEFVNFGALSAGVHTVSFTIPNNYTAGQTVYARFRVFDPANIPGGALTAVDYQGGATGGEVEGYRWQFVSPTAVTLSSLSVNSATPVFLLTGLLLLALATIFMARRRRA